MKALLSALMICAASVAMSAQAEQTAGEKVKDSAKDAGRAVKSGANKVKHKLCTGTKAECAKERLKDGAEGAANATGDKIDEVKDKVD